MDLRKENPRLIIRIWYTLWDHWWMAWRKYVSGRRILNKWDKFGLVKEGQILLDYGCGIGFFTVIAARMVGEKGKVYALDNFAPHMKIVQEPGVINDTGTIDVPETDFLFGSEMHSFLKRALGP